MTDNTGIFQGINWDEGSDSLFLDPGTHETTISDASITRSEKGNLGLWLTFTDDKGMSIRKWTTMPEEDQDKDVYARNTTFLRILLNTLEVPKARWDSLEPSDFVGLDCVIVVSPQKKNPEYNQISKMTRSTGTAPVTKFTADHANVPDDGGFKF